MSGKGGPDIQLMMAKSKTQITGVYGGLERWLGNVLVMQAWALELDPQSPRKPARQVELACNFSTEEAHWPVKPAK